MITNWKVIASRAAKNLEIPDKEVVDEIKLYSTTFLKLFRRIKTKENVKIDFGFYLIGKLKPRNNVVNRIYNSVNTPKWFKYFHKAWKDVLTKGRWRIKGQYNPFKK